jgi:putative heme-binding domain-containing protein
MQVSVWAIRVAVCALAAASLPAQHTFSKNDTEDGQRLYEANCTRCHGVGGNLIPTVDLARGKFIRATTTEDLIRVIRNGIPSAGMPPGNFNDFRAETIVAYIRSMGSTTAVSKTTGDPARGKAVFEGKGGCLRCHRVNGNGARTGPDLSEIGNQRRFAAEIERSILDPSAEIDPLNRTVRLVTRDGATVTGRLLNHDTFSVQILDSKEQLATYLRANLREFASIDKSPMPSYKDKLTRQEVDDVVSYLVSLRGLQ